MRAGVEEVGTRRGGRGERDGGSLDEGADDFVGGKREMVRGEEGERVRPNWRRVCRVEKRRRAGVRRMEVMGMGGA